MHSLINRESTRSQDNERQEWRSWARSLQRRGLANLVSALLESGAALGALAAQGLYISQPLLEPWLPVKSLTAMLEDEEQTRAFATLLREETE